MYTHYDNIRHNFKRCVLARAKTLKKALYSDDLCNNGRKADITMNFSGIQNHIQNA